jgi:hypothetical protein
VPATVDPDGVEPATIRELVDVSGLRVLDVGCQAFALLLRTGARLHRAKRREVGEQVGRLHLVEILRLPQAL